MTGLEESAATDLLRRALMVFQTAQTAFLNAHRMARTLEREEADRFWTGRGTSIEGELHAAAAELDAAFKVFSAAKLVASPADRHLVTEARRHLAEGG